MKLCMRNVCASLLLLAASLATGVVAADQKSEIEKVRNSLKLLLPEEQADAIEPAPVPGLYQVTFGTQVVYVTADGRYLVQGSIIDLETRANLTAPIVDRAKRAAIEAVGEDKMVVFGDKKAKYTVTVFTDIDCGYCRKLHADMDKYLERDIRIRYLFYPRAGLESPSYRKAVAVWCAEDRQKAMTLSKSGKPVEERNCENPVADHFKLGQSMGVTGTPTMVLEDGELLPGYVPPDRLIDYLEYKGNASAKR